MPKVMPAYSGWPYTTALYKAELRAKRACAVLRPGYGAERDWQPPVDPVTGAPGPGMFHPHPEAGAYTRSLSAQLELSLCPT